MKILGLDFGRKKQSTEVAVVKDTVVGATQIGSSFWFGGYMGGVWGSIRESFAGAWQRNIEVDGPSTLLAFSAVFACVTGIAADIGKLPPRVIRLKDGIWEESTDPVVTPLLNRPNLYQNRIKFIEQWIVSKLLWGNTYVLKRRDAAGNVDGMYVLDPSRVKILVSEDGDVYYQLSTDKLAGVGDEKNITVPASEIIHDMMVALWHPLCGVSPIYACAMSATMGNRIQNNSSIFFQNASRPSGVLTAPGAIGNDTAARLKEAWEANFTGSKIGRLAVLGDGLKYDPMTIPAVEAQLIEQLKWTVEDVARAFHYPLYKLGGALPSYNNIEALAQMYYSDCLQPLIESLELSLDNGLNLTEKVGIELDLNNLLRMDSAARYERNNKAIAGGWLAPNEARRTENMRPVEGGDSPMMQQQNYSLAALSKRPPPPDTLGGAPAPAPAPAPDGDEPPPDDEDKDYAMFMLTLLEGAKDMVQDSQTEKV